MNDYVLPPGFYGLWPLHLGLELEFLDSCLPFCLTCSCMLPTFLTPWLPKLISYMDPSLYIYIFCANLKNDQCLALHVCAKKPHSAQFCMMSDLDTESLEIPHPSSLFKFLKILLKSG